MHTTAIEFLRRLVETPGPVGSEGPVQDVFRDHVAPHADDIVSFPHGSVAAVRNPKGSPRVVLTGHADEIGLIVHAIDEKGFVYFRGLGGVDVVALVGSVMEVHTAKGMIHGVVGRKPIHLQEPDERVKVGKISTLYLDIGATSKKDAERRVQLGDPITYRRGMIHLSKDRVTSKAMDNRTGVFCAAEAFRRLGRRAPKACVIALSTIGEEIGGDGAATAAFELKPDVAIAIDVTFADQPGVTNKEASDITLGGGPAITLGPRLNPTVVQLLEKAAKTARIKLQFETAPGRTGTDGDPIYRSRSGVPMGCVGVPSRYMHTPIEVVSLKDLDQIATLLATFARSLGPRTTFAPFR